AGGSPAPNVSITAPTNGSALTGSVSVTATATGSAAIASVQLFLDGANLGSQLTTAPYSVTWNTTNAANGNHILTATATDTTGTAAASAAVGVTVNNAIVAPVITAVTANPTPTGAVILWTTSTPSTSKAFYGTTTAYGQSTSLDSTLVTSHTVILT